MKPTSRPDGEAASANITKRIQELGDWRGEMLARVRQLIHDADSDIQEEWKWRGVPVWSHDGIVCTGESYKQVVKLTFARGAAIKDPKKLFNSSLEGNARRAIDIREGEKINEAAFKQLIRAAVAANSAARRAARARRSKPDFQGMTHEWPCAAYVVSATANGSHRSGRISSALMPQRRCRIGSFPIARRDRKRRWNEERHAGSRQGRRALLGR